MMTSNDSLAKAIVELAKEELLLRSVAGSPKLSKAGHGKSPTTDKSSSPSKPQTGGVAKVKLTANEYNAYLQKRKTMQVKK